MLLIDLGTSPEVTQSLPVEVLQLGQIEISAFKQSIVLTSVHGVIRLHMKGRVHIGNG